jgi:hypothetical protein
MLQMSLGSDEVVLSVLAPPETIAGIAYQGMMPVFADVDEETLGLSRQTVEEQITVHTKAVLVTPVAGVLGDWESLRPATEPRNIQLAVDGQGRGAKWETLAPGVQGMGEHLLRIDEQAIVGGAAGFSDLLAEAGIEAGGLPQWAGRRSDFPGAARAERCVLRVSDWQEHREQIVALARSAARQMSFAFDPPAKRPVRVPARELVSAAG